MEKKHAIGIKYFIGMFMYNILTVASVLRGRPSGSIASKSIH